MAEDPRRDWVERVLGVEFPEAASDDELSFDQPASGPVLPLWVDAKEAFDSGVDKLQRALREQDDPDLLAIGEFGFHGITQGRAVKLMAALRDADGAPSPETRAKAVEAAKAFRDFLEGSPAVRVMTDNPFDVDVPVHTTLVPALDRIRQTLGA